MKTNYIKMKRVLVILSLIVFTGKISAQQTALYSQYIHNPFVLNPAIAGTSNAFQIRFMSRLQWIGFTDAPVTNSLSVYGPVSAKTKDMGYGVTVYSDITSPTSRSGIKGAYAYNRAVNEYMRISFGAALGLMQYKYDGSKVTMLSATDPISPKAVKSFFLPDAMVGVYLWSQIFQVGFSTDNLFNNKLQLDPNSEALSKLKRHFYLFGSYKWIHNRRWDTEYSTLVKYVQPAPPQFDFNVKVTYLKTAWFGVSYRTLDAISLFGGYIFNKRIYAGYSFDYNISPIRNYSFGSHEVMIGYRFNSLK